MKDIRELIKVKPAVWSTDSETSSTNDRGQHVDLDPDDPTIWRAWWGEENVDNYYSKREAQEGADRYFESYIYEHLVAAHESQSTSEEWLSKAKVLILGIASAYQRRDPEQNVVAINALIAHISTPPTGVVIVPEEQIAACVRAVAELPDRNSPEDMPDMMLVTAEELAAILRAHISTPPAGMVLVPEEPEEWRIVGTL